MVERHSWYPESSARTEELCFAQTLCQWAFQPSQAHWVKATGCVLLLHPVAWPEDLKQEPSSAQLGHVVLAAGPLQEWQGGRKASTHAASTAQISGLPLCFSRQRC